VLIARIEGGDALGDRLVEVPQVAELRLVELLMHVRLDLAVQERGGRGDQVVAGVARQQLGLEHLVRIEDVVVDLDAGFLGELGDDVGRDVVGPVVDVQDLFLLSRLAAASGQQKGGGQAQQRQAGVRVHCSGSPLGCIWINAGQRLLFL